MKDQKTEAFAHLLKRRGRLRWTLTIAIVAIYISYGLLGIQFSEAYGASFFDTSLSWGLVSGFVIMALSVVCSLVYVYLSNKMQSQSENS